LTVCVLPLALTVSSSNLPLPGSQPPISTTKKLCCSAVLPSHMLIAGLRERRLVRLLPKVRLLSDTFRLVYRKNSHQSVALGELASFLQQRPLS